MRAFLVALVTISVALPLAAFQAGSSVTSGPPGPKTLVFKSDSKSTKPIPPIPPLTLTDGRLVVSVGNVVTMLAPDGKVLWKYEAIFDLTAPPVFRSDRNEIAIAAVVQFVELDADTGKDRWHQIVNGRSVFTDVKPYGKGYLVLVDMEGYREGDRAMGQKLGLDMLYFWDQTEEDFWHVPFPIGAQLSVTGDRIYAVKHQENTVTLEEIQVPSAKK